MPEIASVSHTHEAIANWLIANPHRSLRECADAFGYTQSWISVIIHSDAFRARLREKQGGEFDRLSADILTKLRAAADVGIEKLQAHLEKCEEPAFILDATDKVLHRLGYAPKQGTAAGSGGTTVNVFTVPQDVLRQHRERIIEGERVQDALGSS